MSARSLNGLSGNTTNVYVNTNLSATLPLEENQSSFNNPITISLKGLNGLGTAGQIIKMNAGGTALEYGDADPSFIRIADETIGSNSYGILYDPTYPKSLGNAYLKYHTNGTDLRLNTRVGTSTGIHLDYGNSNVFSFLSGGTMKVKNSGQSQYEFTYPNQSGTIALTSGIPTQYWGFSSTNTGVVYPTSTAYSVLIGTSTPSSVSYSLETSKSILCGDKLDVLDDLTVSNIWRVEYSSPYTYFYDPTNYSSSNPFNQYHTNGTLYLSNLPVNNGSSSNFKWSVGNSKQLMNLDANGLLTVFGTTQSEIKIMNDGNTNDVSILNFTNNSSPDFYKFEFKNSANTFTLWNYTNPVFNHDAVNDIFTIEADLTVKNNIYNTSAIDIKCSNASGAKSILDFSIAGVGMKFQYIYDLNSDSFLLKNIAGTTLTSINTFNEFTTSMKTTIQNQLILTGSAPQISNGTYTYTLPSSSGTLALEAGGWENFNSITLKPSNTSIEAILVKNAIEFYDSYSSPTEGYQILVNHTDNTFKITNLSNNKNIFTFDNDTDIITSTMKHSISNQLVLTGSSPQISNGTQTFTLPNSSGTLALTSNIPSLTNNIRLADITNYGIIYDPSYTLSLANSSLNYHTNGSTVRLNCRVNNGGSGSNIGLDFANNNVFRFDSSGTINVKNSGQSMYSFNTPNKSGTIALTDDIYWTKVGTELQYGAGDVRFNSLVAYNSISNKIINNTSYGWQFQGTSARQISITGATSYYPFIGSSSSYPYVNHINNIGDAYRISGTAASNLKHEFFGRVGIQIASPAVPLHVASQSSGGGTFTSGFYARSYAAGGGFASNNGYSAWNTDPISIVGEGGGYFKTGYIVASDRRIKTNIEDVPDNLALEYLRDIPCRYYEYIDKTRGYDKTIGFIAQEVKEIFPLAVSIGEEIVPDVYKNITCIWTEKEDKFILSSPDLTNVSGIEYLFYGLCECEENEERISCVGNEDNTFTFDKKFDTVFCYGSEVKDFNRLSHEKLFTLNFSATQEIDKIQQTHITEIALLKEENETLKIELEGLKGIINKLVKATSFKNFKETIA